MDTKTEISVAPGHWVLARMGKRVLRPGGRELTLKMIESLAVSSEDEIVEFAPGMGFTAKLVNMKKPKHYTAVELNEEAAERLQKIFNKENQCIVLGNAANTGLNSESADKVYGEAMLTMQNEKQKKAIIKEAHRILKKGGLYGIHEIALSPEDITEEKKQNIHKDLAQGIKVNARPLTTKEWKELFEKEGFNVKTVVHNPMQLLEPKRILQDEGLLRSLKIGLNILRNKKARKRIKQMRNSFLKNEKNMQAIAIIAEKI